MSLTTDLKDFLDELSCPFFHNIDMDKISLIELSRLLNWISQQMNFFAKTDSIVNMMTDESDIESFKVELNSLLNEIGSVFANSFSLETIEQRQLVLFTLAGDLFAARLQHFNNFSENLSDFTVQEINPKKDLAFINNSLSINDDFQSVPKYFQKVKDRLQKSLISKFQEEDSLFLPNNRKLTVEQWASLKKINEKLRADFSLRREILIRRADMTINSFAWKKNDSDSLKEEKTDDKKLIESIYQKLRKPLQPKSIVTLSHALAARSSDCEALMRESVSSHHANCTIKIPNYGKANIGEQQRLQLHRFLIGSVPDRGGRPIEQIAPPKETFQQQQNQRDNYGNRGRGRGRGGGDRQQYQNYRQDNRGYQQPKQQFYDQGNSRIQNAGWQREENDNNYNSHDNQRGNHHEQDHRRRGGRGFQRGGRGRRNYDNYYY